jgi:hypothetical protein
MQKLVFKKNNTINEPLNHWSLDCGTILAIYQGNRGQNPELDYVVKYLAPNKRLRAPSHTHWIVDLLIKADKNLEIVKNYISEWIEIYEKELPFLKQEDRIAYKLKYGLQMSKKYEVLNSFGDFSVEFLSSLIELFVKCEKQNHGAYMFKNMLQMVKDYCENKKDFYQIISHSKRV